MHADTDDRRGLEPVGATALGIAFSRAQESRRADRLFDDPYAERFVAAGAQMSPLAPTMTSIGSSETAAVWTFLTHHVAIRTRFFDDYLLESTGAGCRQVVLVAVGLDTRGLRLAWPAGVRVFELDQEPVLEFKERVLGGLGQAAADRRVLVPVDLRNEWQRALTDAGFDPAERSAWLIEGLFPALTPAQSDTLLERVGPLAAGGSVLAYDDTGDTASMTPLLEILDPELVKIWQGGPAGDPASWLAGHGWDPGVLDQAEVSRRYGRTPGPEPADWPRPRLIRARRR